jgi:hypothetical protein
MMTCPRCTVSGSNVRLFWEKNLNRRTAVFLGIEEYMVHLASHATNTKHTKKTLPNSLISCTRSASCDLSAAGADTRVELTISKMTGSHHILRTSSRPSRAGAAMGAGYLAGVGDCACWFRRKQSWLGLAVPWSPIAIEALPPCSSNGHTHRYIAYVFL